MNFNPLKFWKGKTTKQAVINIPQSWPINLPSNFIPITNFQGTINDKLVLLFNCVPEVNAIVTYIATNSANVPLKHVKIQSNGKEKEIKNSNYIKLLDNPNEFESGRTLRANAFTNFFVCGNSYINTLTPVGFSEPSKLYCLPSNKIVPITNQTDQQGNQIPGNDPRLAEILYFKFDLGNNKYARIEPDQMAQYKDTSIDSWTVGKSRLSAAVDSIESLRGLNDTLNSILSKGGALGFIKKNRKANDPSNIIAPDEKSRIETAFYNYGVSKGKSPYFFTDEDLSFQRILSQLSDFMPVEIKDSEFKTICQVLGGFPDVLLKATDTTFANMQTAEKILYTNIIMPLLDGFCELLTNRFGLAELGEALVPDYSEIKSLQDDQKQVAESQKAIDELWLNRYKNNLCTLNEALEAMNLQQQTDGNKYYGQGQIDQTVEQ